VIASARSFALLAVLTSGCAALPSAPSPSAITAQQQAARIADERLTLALRQLPALARDEAAQAIDEFLRRPEIAQLRTELHEGRVTVDSLGASIDRARVTAEQLGAALDDAQGIDIPGLTAFAIELRGAATEIHASLPDARTTIAELKLTIEAAERVSVGLRDLTRGPAGEPLDLTALSAASDRFATASSDLRQAIAQANALLSSDEATRRLEEIGRTGRLGIDHAVWRLGQLFVIGASLTIVLRIVWILTRPRAEPAPRPARR